MTLRVRDIGLELRFQEWNKKLTAIDTMVEDFRNDCAAGAINTLRLWAVIDTLNKWVPALNAVIATAGMPAYIIAQGGGATPVADWVTTRTALLALRDAIGGIIPVAGGGLEQVITHQVDHSRVYRDFPTIETSPLLALCDAVTASLV